MREAARAKCGGLMGYGNDGKWRCKSAQEGSSLDPL